jgi:uncharacterized protein (DUF433 family)
VTAEQKRRLDEAVWVAPQRMSGTLCFRGTRVPVQSLINFLEDGEALDRFLQTYPAIAREQVAAIIGTGWFSAARTCGLPQRRTLPTAS